MRSASGQLAASRAAPPAPPRSAASRPPRCGTRPPAAAAAADTTDVVVAETVPVSMLSPQEVVDALACSITPPHATSLTAFYSSELGGVTTEPGLFVVHADDHAFHRGHAVFDTAEIVDGRLYDLEAHLDRFCASADAARLPLPASRAQVRRIILETAAAGRSLYGHVRYWLGAGRGGLALSPAECVRPSLFVMAYKVAAKAEPVAPTGVSVRTATTVHAPDAPLATMKTTNYLRHALAQMEADDAGYDYAVFTDADGFVTDGATVTPGIITADGEFVVPPAGAGLAGCTAERVLTMLPKWLDTVPSMRDTISAISRRPLPLSEALAAPHAFVMGSSTGLRAVTRWDTVDKDGPTLLVKKLTELVASDKDPLECPDPWMHTEVPFAILTGGGEGGFEDV